MNSRTTLATVGLCAGMFLALPAALSAQDLDVYWQANRKSKTVTKLSACGEVLLTVDLSKNIPTGQPSAAELRSAHMAPDGQVWVVNFIRPYLTLLDANGKNLRNINTQGGGSPYTLAFDKAGNAFVSNPGSDVEMYDKSGKFLKSFKIAGTALGLTIDSNGFVWASHRLAPPSKVTKIDPAKGTWTDFALPGGATTMGGSIVAGYNGLLRQSDIFVCGDRSSELIHFDNTGKVLGTYVLDATSTQVGALTIDAKNNVWVGNWSNGKIYKFDPAQKQVVGTLSNSPNVLGLAIDSRGRLLATTRVSFSGPQPSEVRRYNVTTNQLEQVSTVGIGAGSAASSGFHRALVLDPFGDADNDADANFNEVTNFTAPFDSQSNMNHGLVAVGSHALGGTVEIRAEGKAGATAVMALSLKTLATPLCLGAWTGCLKIDPALMFPSLFIYTVPGKLTATIPNSAAIRGIPVYFQALYALSPTMQPSFSNVECVLPY